MSLTLLVACSELGPCACLLHACILRLVVAAVDQAGLYLTSCSIHAVVYFCGVFSPGSAFFLAFFDRSVKCMPTLNLYSSFHYNNIMVSTSS